MTIQTTFTALENKVYAPLNSVVVHFEDARNDYETSVSSNTTEETAKAYFVGTCFDVGSYPNEVYRRCTDITFTDNTIQ